MSDSIFKQIGSIFKTSLDNAISTETSARTTAISDEATARNNAIATETTNRENADSVLETALRNAMFSGTMNNITYDSNKNIIGYTQNNLTVSNIVYNSDGNVSTLTETVTINGTATVKNFSVAYNSDGNVTGITEV